MEKMRSDSNEFDVANRKIFTECCGTIENLSENQEYQFRVKAVNEVGDGEPSKPITARIQDDESMTPFAVDDTEDYNLRILCRYLLKTDETLFLFSSVAPVITILKFFKNNTITVRKGAAVDIPAEVKALPLATILWSKDKTVIEKPDEEKMTLETEEVRTQHLFLHIVFLCHIRKQLYTHLCTY